MLAALVRRPDETLQQLLERLDRAVQLAMEHEIFTDASTRPSRRLADTSKSVASSGR